MERDAVCHKKLFLDEMKEKRVHLDQSMGRSQSISAQSGVHKRPQEPPGVQF